MASVMLVVVGDDLDPEVVSMVLGLEAHRSWRRGERRSFVRPDGSLRYFDSVNERCGWKHFLSASEREGSLEEQLFLWLDRLQKIAEAVQVITAKGWEVELDCFATGSEVLVLSSDNLRTLADLSAGLSLTLAQE